MKARKAFVISIVFSVLIVTLSACGASSQDTEMLAENALLKAENAALAEQNEELTAQIEQLNEKGATTDTAAEQVSEAPTTEPEQSVNAYASGQFVATVYAFVPEFGFAPEEYTPVIVSEFQSGRLFAVLVEKSIASTLELKNTYLYDCMDVYISDLDAEDVEFYSEYGISATEAAEHSQIFVTGVGEPAEDQLGLASPVFSIAVEQGE